MDAEHELKKQLEAVRLPEIDHPLGAVARIAAVTVDGPRVSIDIALGFPAATRHTALREALMDAARDVASGGEIDVALGLSVATHGVQPNLKPLPGVANIVAVASGKGGVGKSTTAVNLSLALARDGAQVGLLDADIYGPSVPIMLGLGDERPQSDDGKTMRPLRAHALQVMSIGSLIDADQPMVWRGPMVTSALSQLLRQTRWEALDYLIVDMPPGTGDIQLTLTQQVPVSGAVIVTTPQDIALADAQKGLQMFRKVSVPVLGIVENMSTHWCTQCGHEDAVFGYGGGERMAAEYGVPLLGQLPLDRSIREQADGGSPTVVAAPDSPHAGRYHVTAQRLAAELASRGKDYSHRFPKIVVEETG